MFARPTIAQVLLFLVESRPGLTEPEYAEIMFGEGGYQQRVNADSNYLESKGFIRIDSGDGQKRLYPTK